MTGATGFLTFDHDNQFVWRVVCWPGPICSRRGRRERDRRRCQHRRHGCPAPPRSPATPDRGRVARRSQGGQRLRIHGGRRRCGGVPRVLRFRDGDEYGAAEDAEDLAAIAPNAELLLVELTSTAPTSSPRAVLSPTSCGRRCSASSTGGGGAGRALRLRPATFRVSPGAASSSSARSRRRSSRGRRPCAGWR